MGLIAFFKDAGEKLFGKKPEVAAAVAEPGNAEKAAAASTAAADAIKTYIAAQQLPTDGLDIRFDATRAEVTVSGLVASQDIREKIVLCCGNVAGVASVVDQLQSPEAAAPSEFHMVAKGDTLSAIAKRYYGNANAYMAIFEANRPMLSHPDKIYPGQNLRIPPKDR